MKTIRFFDPKREINFVKYFHASLVIAATIPLVAVFGSMIFGINWGIDFSGGTEMQVLFQEDVGSDKINVALEEAGFTKHQVQRYGAAESKEMLIRIERLATFKPEDIIRINELVSKKFPGEGKSLSQVRFNADVGDRLTVVLPEPKIENRDDNQAVAKVLSTQRAELAQLLDDKSGFKLRRTKGLNDQKDSMVGAVMQDEPKDGLVNYSVHFIGVSDKIAMALAAKFGKVEVRRVEFVDSQVSGQLRSDGALAVFYALLAILIYIAIRFDIFFAPGAIVALVQDTFGAFLVFVFAHYEFDLPSVAALLAVLGISINNTIVVYDRIRETAPVAGKTPVDDAMIVAAVNKAIHDTLGRTIMTTLTTLIASLALWHFAGGVIESFAMVLTVGLALGSLSSTLAAPATYLFMRRHFGHLSDTSDVQSQRGRTREDKARGVV